MAEELKPHHYWREDRITGRLVVITPDEYEQWGKDNQPSEAYRPAFTCAQLPNQGGEAVEVFTTWHPDSRSYEEQIVSHDTKGSRKALGAMNAKLRAKVGRLERELATVKQSLTVEPVAYAAFAENGNIRMWCRSAIGMCELFDAHGNKAVPLYTHPADQVAQPDAELVRQCIAQELATWEGDFKGPVHTAMRCLQVRIDAKMATLK